MMQSSWSSVEIIQLTILLIYLVGLLGIGYLSTRLDASMEEYFLADRGLGAWLSGISSAASSESGWVTLGAVGMGYALGSSAAWFIPGCLLGYCVNWYFVAPRLRRISANRDLITLPDFLEYRVDDRLHLVRIVSVLIIFVAMATYIGAQFKASGKLFASLFFQEQDTGRTIGILIGAGFTVLYTVFGGFRASSWTDLVQGVIIATGLGFFPLFLMIRMGGVPEFTNRLEKVPARGWIEFSVSVDPVNESDSITRSIRLDTYQKKQVVSILNSSISLHDQPSEPPSDAIRFIVHARSNTSERHRNHTEYSYELKPLTEMNIHPVDPATKMPTDDETKSVKRSMKPVPLTENTGYVINRKIHVHSISIEQLNAGEDLVDAFGATNNEQNRDDHTDSGALPVLPISSSLGFVLGLLGIGLGYPGMPHVLSRFMATRDQKRISQARVISIGWGILAFYGAVVIGMIARIQLPPSLLLDQENAFPVLATRTLNPVLSGLLISAILSAIMSTADSMMIVASSAVSRDLYQHIFAPDCRQERLVLLSRCTVFVLGVLGVVAALLNVQLIFWFVLVAWAILGASFGPPVLLGLWWEGLSRWGVLSGMITGAATAIIWKQFPIISEMLFGQDVYQLVPAFLLSFVVTGLVSLCSNSPENASERMGS